MRSFRGMDISSSTVQGWFTWPEMLKSLVPEFLSLPKPRNHEPPRRQMVGATDTVSTLATVVGQPNTPWRQRTNVRHKMSEDSPSLRERREPTDVGGERRLQAGFSLLPFQGLDECRLLPADVRSGSAHHKHIKVVTGAARVFPNESSGVGFINSHLFKKIQTNKRDKL